jgi:hypothetical protein
MKALTARPLTAVITASVLGSIIGTIPLALADDDDNPKRVSARLSGFNEVHFIAGNAAATPPVAPALRGAVSTKGTGRFSAHIDDAAQQITYELRYDGLEGDVTQSHIHFGQRHTTGGITIWLCQTPSTPAPAAVAGVTPFCPTPGGTVTGTIAPAQVLAVAGQGIAAGEFAEIVRAIRAGATYANVHSTLFPPGEIRGQIRAGGR